MFKKTILVAALGAISAGAYAADVELYGVVDTGLKYTHEKWQEKSAAGKDTEKDQSFTMESGTNSATRFGLRGSEDLGNGLKVGFKLENGFSSDTGALGENRIFGREASVNVSGDFGTVYAGRMGILRSDTGSVGFYGAMASAFGSGWSDNIAGHTFVMADYVSRRDNVLTYVSPEFAGTTLYAQYAMGGDDKIGSENKTTADRYAAIGAKWAGGPFEVGALVDWQNKSNRDVTINNYTLPRGSYSIKDAYTVNLAGSYDCGFAKTYLALQYFKDANDGAGLISEVASTYSADDAAQVMRLLTVTGYGVHLSTAFDALGGSWKAGIGYMDGDADLHVADTKGFNGDVKAYTASVGYEYALSKRTMVYTGMGYTQRELDVTFTDAQGNSKDTVKGFDFAMGLVHRF
ncbi:MAG: porin [Sutterella sp.]|nr:porin [Sutterella sp.]